MLSKEIAVNVKGGSMIRKMFEEGNRLKAIYGAENVFASDLIKDKIISNNVKKYGVVHYSKTDKGRKKLSECAKNSLYKRCKTCKERYGVDYALANSDIA